MSGKVSRTVYLNGQFLPVEQAHVSVMDRGFLLGDGIYEVIPVFQGRLFRAEQHLQRLQRSLDSIELDLSVTNIDWQVIFSELLKRNAHLGSDQSIYLQITRGSAERTHYFPDKISPTIFVQSTPFKPLSYTELCQGSTAITLDDIRWNWCYIKATTLLPNALFAQRAKQAKANEAILLRNGHAIEGTSSNLFIVKNGILRTPPLTPQILPGVTRELVLELSTKHQLSYLETAITEQELRSADEIWLTGSIKEILPIVELDNKPIGAGKVGPLWHIFYQFYQDCKQY